MRKCRRVYVNDEASVSIPKTPLNQRDDPQPETQNPGLDFPLTYFAVVFSFACGVVLDPGNKWLARGSAV